MLAVHAEMSDSQQQIQGINRQYDQLGESLSDRQRELQFMMLGIASFREDFERILVWLDVTEQQLNEHGDDCDEPQQVGCYLFAVQAIFLQMYIMESNFELPVGQN